MSNDFVKCRSLITTDFNTDLYPGSFFFMLLWKNLSKCLKVFPKTWFLLLVLKRRVSPLTQCMLGSLWEADCTWNSPSSSFKLTRRLWVDLYVCAELIRVTVNVLLQHFKGVVQELNRYSCIHSVSKATYRHFCSVEARLHYCITWQKASASPWIICFMLIQQKNTINVRDKDVKGGSSFIIWSWQDCTVSTSIFKTPPSLHVCALVLHIPQ